METAEKTIASTGEVGAVSMSPSASLLADLELLRKLLSELSTIASACRMYADQGSESAYDALRRCRHLVDQVEIKHDAELTGANMRAFQWSDIAHDLQIKLKANKWNTGDGK